MSRVEGEIAGHFFRPPGCKATPRGRASTARYKCCTGFRRYWMLDAGCWMLDNQTVLRRRTPPIQNPGSGIQDRLRMISSFLPESTSSTRIGFCRSASGRDDKVRISKLRSLLQNYSPSWFDTSPRTENQHVTVAKSVRPEVSKGEKDFCKRLSGLEVAAKGG
jgi:hypothetical protein